VMAKVLELVEELPADQREVLYLSMWLNWKEAEIAEELGVATKTVERRLTRAKVTLGGWLRQWLAEREKDIV
jgi:RNA polymerase sigma factor (sigma-70 family)